MTKISSLSINGRILLNMHSLNNEGSEGTQTLTRQVIIIDEKGEPKTVTAVSGDMLKHIQVEHLYNISKNDGLILCEGCEKFNANRITIDKKFIEYLKKIDLSLLIKKDKEEHDKLIKEKEQVASEIKDEEDENKIKELKKQQKEIDKKKNELEKKCKPTDEEKTNEVIKRCVIDDLAGILVTAEKNNLPKKSVAEFGWLVALPEANETDSYFHVKFVPDSSNIETAESNRGQNIYHRPANSGIYAFVGNFDISRIGYNEISRDYAIDDTDRNKRYKALLQSILYTFLKPAGAMRNTQNPHIVNFEGVITYSTSTCPAPTVSPLNSDYSNEIEKIVKSLNQLENNSITIKKFKSLSEFTKEFTEIINQTCAAELGDIMKAK